jgi:hypothetical protein
MKCRTCHTDTGTTHDGQCTYCWTLTPRTEPARTASAEFASTDWVAELEAVQTQLEDAWTALCKQDWGAATQNVFDVRASVTKLVESVRGHSATVRMSDAPLHPSDSPSACKAHSTPSAGSEPQ